MEGCKPQHRTSVSAVRSSSTLLSSCLSLLFDSSLGPDSCLSLQGGGLAGLGSASAFSWASTAFALCSSFKAAMSFSCAALLETHIIGLGFREILVIGLSNQPLLLECSQISARFVFRPFQTANNLTILQEPFSFVIPFTNKAMAFVRPLI